jgi:hypothetical protein
MDGRMRFDLTLEADKLALFEQTKPREIVLNERLDRVFELSFHLVTTDSPDPAVDSDLPEALSDVKTASNAAIPEYVSVEMSS